MQTYLLFYTDLDTPAEGTTFEEAWSLLVRYRECLGRAFVKCNQIDGIEGVRHIGRGAQFGKFVELEWTGIARERVLDVLRPYCYYSATLSVLFTVDDLLGFCTAIGKLPGWQPDGGLIEGYLADWEDVLGVVSQLGHEDGFISFCHDGDPVVLIVKDSSVRDVESLLRVAR